MELFTITCTTCRARLKVRHRSAIGQILGCPRCGSMVQVTPPAGWQPPADTRPAGDSDPDHLGDWSRAADDSAEPPTAPAASPAGIIDEGPHPARTGLWIALGLAAVVLVAVLAIVMALRPGPEARLAQAPSAETPADQGPAPANGAPAEEAATPLVSGEPESSPPPADEAQGSPPSADTPGAVTSPEQSPETAPPADEAAGAPPSESAAAAATAEAANLPPEDPFAELPVAEPPTSDQPAPGDTAGEAAEPAPGPNTSDTALGDAAPAEAPAAADDAAPGDAPSAADDWTDSEAPVDVEARLADSLEAFTVREMPLCDLLRLLTQASTVRTSLDLDGLRLAGLAPELPIQIATQATTFGGLLERALQPHGLHTERRGQVLWITPGQPGQELETARYELSELRPSDAQTLPALVAALVEPGTWEPAGQPGQIGIEAGQLRVVHQARVQAEVRLLLARLGASRRQGAKPGDPAGAQWISPWLSAATALTRPVTASFFRETPLVAVLVYLERAGGMRLLLNAAALEEAGVSPNTPVQFSVEGAPLAGVLGQILGQIGLFARPFSPSVVEITTAAALSTPELQAYPLQAGLDVSPLDAASELRTFLESQKLSPAEIVVWPDTDGRILWLRGQAPVHWVAATWLYERRWVTSGELKPEPAPPENSSP